MFIAELDEPDFAAYDLSSLRTGIMAGATCPIEVMRRVVTGMHMAEVTIAYGMTETSPVSFQSNTSDSIERRVATVGTIHPHLEVKIVDSDGRVVPRNHEGELLTRGYSVMRGYWGDPEATRHVIDDRGWMHTGDIAVLDEDGYCRIVGRLKDIIIRGGENISPREIEECLYQHAAVQDVAVFGVPDPQYGEEVCAWVRLKTGPSVSVDELRQFCRLRISHFKVPRHISLVDDFPMTVTGKLQKFIMREQMSDRLKAAS
jgi:fatty-acyl-CoA synthase